MASKIGSTSAADQPSQPASAQASKAAGTPRMAICAFTVEEPPSALPRQ
jgi:hypothetical protein